MMRLVRWVGALALPMTAVQCQAQLPRPHASLERARPVPPSVASPTPPSVVKEAESPSAPSADEAVTPRLARRRIVDEPSRYGRFTLAVRDDATCHVSVLLASASEVQLLSAPDCSEEENGMNALEAARQIGAVALPFIAPNGDELHVFQIGTARGGNATDAVDYWVVAVRAGEAWSTSIEAAVLSVAAPSDTVPGALVLEEPATTTEVGQRYLVSFGSARRTELPRLPSKVVSRETRDLYGDLDGGFHASNWRPVLSGEGPSLAIDEKGRCALPEVGQQLGRVSMKVEVTTWSDGRTFVKCLSVERQ